MTFLLERIFTTKVGLGLCQRCECSIGAGDEVFVSYRSGIPLYWHEECRVRPEKRVKQ